MHRELRPFDHSVVRRILITARDNGYSFSDCFDAVRDIYVAENPAINLLRKVCNLPGYVELEKQDPDVTAFAKIVNKKLSAREQEMQDAKEGKKTEGDGSSENEELESMRKIAKKLIR